MLLQHKIFLDCIWFFKATYGKKPIISKFFLSLKYIAFWSTLIKDIYVVIKLLIFTQIVKVFKKYFKEFMYIETEYKWLTVIWRKSAIWHLFYVFLTSVVYILFPIFR